MKKPVTIKDVAKKAGVSISTVSRVINDSKPVTDEVKQKVVKVIEETGYVPNPLARSLVTKKSQLLGVVVPDVTDSFAADILNGIEEVAKMYNYDILLANTYSEKEKEMSAINLLRAKQVEGIVVISWLVEQETIDFMKNNGIPAVYISKTARDYDVCSVATKNTEATKSMTKFLIEKGHNKIGFIMTSRGKTVMEGERLAGYKAALKDSNIEFDKALVKNASTDYESGYDKAKELLDAGANPDAIFVTGDEAAIGAMNAAIDSGYKVPEDISIAGFNDVKLARMYRPKLATIHQPLFDMGAVAVRMIIKMIDGKEIEEKKVQLSYEIIDRESVKDRN